MANDAERPNRMRQAMIAGLAVIAAIVLWLIGAAVIPRWWAQRVADVVDGRLTVGALFGAFVGFVFSVLPLGLGAAVVRWRSQRRRLTGWIGWLLAMIVTAAPNLMTLGIVMGNGNAAHAGERILDVDAPGFRAWSLIGAIAGVLGMLAVFYLVRSRRQSRDRATQLRDELKRRDT